MMTATRLPAPLTGPGFGSYRPDEVSWLLTDLSALDLEARHRRSGRRRSRPAARTTRNRCPSNTSPTRPIRRCSTRCWPRPRGRLAHAVGAVTELVLAERGTDVVLASLARAGTPIGILMRRWAQRLHGLRPAALRGLDRPGPGDRPGRAGLPCRPS